MTESVSFVSPLKMTVSAAPGICAWTQFAGVLQRPSLGPTQVRLAGTSRASSRSTECLGHLPQTGIESCSFVRACHKDERLCHSEERKDRTMNASVYQVASHGEPNGCAEPPTTDCERRSTLLDGKSRSHRTMSRLRGSSDVLGQGVYFSSSTRMLVTNTSRHPFSQRINWPVTMPN